MKVREGQVHALVDRYVDGRRRRGVINALTARNQRYILRDFAGSFGNRPVERMGRSDIERWLEQGRYKPAAQRSRRSIVLNFTRWLVKEGVLKRDPGTEVERITQPRTVPVTFDQGEIGELLAACPDARARLMVLLEVQLGLRCVEVARLQLGDISGRWVHVRGKGGHERTVWLVDEAQEALRDYLVQRGGAAGPLFVSYTTGTALARATISAYINTWIRHAHLKSYPYDGRSAHGLRRTGLSDMAEHGADPFDIQEAAGWASVATANHYMRRRVQRLAQVMEGRRYGDAKVHRLPSEAAG